MEKRPGFITGLLASAGTKPSLMIVSPHLRILCEDPQMWSQQLQWTQQDLKNDEAFAVKGLMSQFKKQILIQGQSHGPKTGAHQMMR